MHVHPTQRLARATLVTVVTLVLASCATSGRYGYSEPRVPAGSTVELEQELELPVGKPRVYVQGGKVTPWGNVNWFEPYCWFGLRRQDDEQLAREIRPDRFETREASRSWAQASRTPVQGVQVAASGWPRLAMGAAEGSPGRYTFHTRIPLHSPDQPQVDHLECAYDGDDFDTFPTLAEMRATLDGVASIRLPNE